MPCFDKAVDNDETFHTFCEEEKAELLPKNIAKIARKHSKEDTCYLKNICQTNIPLYPELDEKRANEEEKLISIDVSMF